MPIPTTPAKLRNISGLLHVKEATYNDASVLAAATDAFLVHPDDRAAAWIERFPANDGNMGLSVATLDQLKRAAPTGFAHRGEIPGRFKGPGVAYSASQKSTIHRWLEAAGFDATLTATPGSELFTFNPTADSPTGYASLAMEAYQGGEKWKTSGARASVKISAENGGPPKIMFPFIGIEKAMPSDAGVPGTIAYPFAAIDWPLASALTLNLGSYVNLLVKKWEFDWARKIDNARGGLQSAHAGFWPSDREPQIRVTVEATALVGTPYHTSAGLDPYQLHALATSISTTALFGATQYNQLEIVAANCQLAEPPKPVGGPTMDWELVLRPHASTFTANDSVVIKTK